MLIMKFIDEAVLSAGAIGVLKQHAETVRTSISTLDERPRQYFAELVEIADEAIRLISVFNPNPSD